MCLFCIYFFIMFHFPHRTVLSWHTYVCTFETLCLILIMKCWSWLVCFWSSKHWLIILSLLSFFSSACVSNVALRRVQNLQKRVLYKVGFWKRWSLERVWRGEGSDNDDNDNNNKVCVCMRVCVCLCVCVCASSQKFVLTVCCSLLCNGLCAPVWRNST